MFCLRDFVKSGFIKAVGSMADYQIILNAAGWLEKGVLAEADLAEIQAAIDSQYATEITEEPQDEISPGDHFYANDTEYVFKEVSDNGDIIAEAADTDDKEV